MNELADRPVRVADEFIAIHWWRMLRWFSNLRLYSRWSSRYELASNPLRKFIRRVFYEGLTRSGKIIFFCSLIIFLQSYRVGSSFLLITSALGFSMLAWSALLGYFYKPRVSVQRQSAETAVAGEQLHSQIRVRNEGSLALNNFAVRELLVPQGKWPHEWQREYRTTLAPGQETVLTVSLEPRSRGVMNLSGVAVHSYFPFFLTRYTSKLEATAKVYILPPTLKATVPSLRHVAEQASKRMSLGNDNAREGPAMEYAYSRPYQTGDSLRRLDHRASSRRGEPMSKIFEGADEIRRDKVHLIVDLTVVDFKLWQRRPDSEQPLDERLALAVEIGLSAQNEGFTLSALATGTQWHKLENLFQFYQHIASCLPQRLGGVSLPDTVLAEDGLYILVIGRWDNAAQTLVEKLQQAGVLVLVFLIAESAADVGTLPTGSYYVEVPRP